MAETNAYFEELVFEEAAVSRSDTEIVITFSGQYLGESNGDKMFSGDTLDVNLKMTLFLAGSMATFSDFDFQAGGQVNDDWLDPESDATMNFG